MRCVTHGHVNEMRRVRALDQWIMVLSKYHYDDSLVPRYTRVRINSHHECSTDHKFIRYDV